MAADDFALLQPALKRVQIERGAVLHRAHEGIDHVYFPESGIASVLGVTPKGARVELGLYGREGMGPTAVLLRAETTPHEVHVQISGAALKLDAAVLREIMEDCRTLHGRLLRYAQAAHVQTAQTALVNATEKIGARAARWLLMCHDRTDGNTLGLTHSVLSFMLGVRRAGVTMALQHLEKAGAVSLERKTITVANRRKLESAANGSYGTSESEYQRLLSFAS
jgi:CRP-like cAMP-binding protein